jgi:Caspase domain
MGVCRTIVWLLVVFWLGCGPAFAEKRVALVIGNSAYEKVPRLTNPTNDATVVAAMLKNAGFDAVTTKLNVGVVEMRKSLREFGAQTRDADVAVIFYAGHGIELDGNNYLIPIDAILETDADVLDETLPLDRVLFSVEPAKQLRLIILDACRDNPFAKTMKRTIATRAIGRGLAKVEPNSPNTMIAFAAKAGSTALDGDSRNSPFALALVEHLPKPGLDLRKAFGFVRDDVLKNTGYKQEPYVYGSLGGDDVPLVPAKPVSAAPQPNPEDAVRRDYELALQLGTRDGWNAFLVRYPTGFYADLARGQLNKIAAEEARATAAEKAHLAEQEKARLAAEGARKAEQEKAAQEARAAEQARVAAEKAKQIEIEKVAAAEQARILAEKAAAEKLAAEKAANVKAAELAATQNADKQAVEISANGKVDDAQKMAALTPPPSDTSKPALSAAEVVKLVQRELRRVGCLTVAADSEWNSTSERSLTLFNKYAGTRFDVKLASLDVLDAIKAKPSRVCPVVCDHGFKVDGDRCIKIICRVGYLLNDKNECERSRKQPAEQDAKRVEKSDSKPQGTAAAKPQASGRMFCGLVAGTTATFRCRPLKKGCHVGDVPDPRSSGRLTTSGEVCD